MPKYSQNICDELKSTVVCRVLPIWFSRWNSRQKKWLCHYFLEQLYYHSHSNANAHTNAKSILVNNHSFHVPKYS